jgi:ribose transport system ATP-binding protein
LQEIHRIADTVTVLRNGRLVGRVEIHQATPATIVEMMFGDVVRKERPADLLAGSDVVLEVEGLSRKGAFEAVNFSLRRGEVLGIAGLLGSGRTELLRGLFGADPVDSGTIIINGTRVQPTTPTAMKEFGLALTPENRKDEGLVQLLSTRTNLCLSSLGRISRHGFTSRRNERRFVDRRVADAGITVADVEAPVSSLSGGNQQKVVVGKWLNNEPRVMLLDEPTRGIDIQAKQQMFQLIWDLSARGIGSIVVSSELEELMDVCHRIVIMKQGTLVGEILPQQSSLEQLFARCMT